MKTRSLTLFYTITTKEILPPNLKDVERKEQWIKEIQKTVEADYKPLLMKVNYELWNPEIYNQLRFFNGIVVLYYAIQNMDMFTGLPDSKTLDQYREYILDELLGFDFQTVQKVIRKRKSTKNFKTVQAWNNFLELCRENLFDSAGYEFPDSDKFWDLVKAYGYDEAKRISIDRLQTNLALK